MKPPVIETAHGTANYDSQISSFFMFRKCIQQYISNSYFVQTFELIRVILTSKQLWKYSIRFCLTKIIQCIKLTNLCWFHSSEFAYFVLAVCIWRHSSNVASLLYQRVYLVTSFFSSFVTASLKCNFLLCLQICLCVGAYALVYLLH